jgi:hypothetical protein
MQATAAKATSAAMVNFFMSPPEWRQLRQLQRG